MDKPKELVTLFQKLEKYDNAGLEYNRINKQKKEAQSEYFSCMYDVQYNGIGSRIIDYILAAHLLSLKREDVCEGALSFTKLNDTAVTCTLFGHPGMMMDIPYSIFSMSDAEYQVLLGELYDEKAKQRFKEEEEKLEKEEIEHYLSLLKHKVEVEKQLEYYQKEYGSDVELLSKRLD